MQICIWQKSNANNTCGPQRPFPQVHQEGDPIYLPSWYRPAVLAPTIRKRPLPPRRDVLPYPTLRPHSPKALQAASGQEITGLLNLYLVKQMFNPLQCKGKSVPHPPTSLKPPQNASVLGFLAPTAVTQHDHPFRPRTSSVLCSNCGLLSEVRRDGQTDWD